jgi:cytochrome P450
VTAGTLTTAAALSIMLFYLLSQPNNLRKLKEELKAAIPNRSHLPPVSAIEQLPYLTACIKEGLRISNGVTGRLQRISPAEPMTFTSKSGPNAGKSYVIPPGTPISMNGMLIHFNESYFPDPYEFKPDRWLENTVNPTESRLEKYLVPFTKGTRQCLGINLAYAEMYLMMAGLFRKYGSPDVRDEDDEGVLELFETTRDDVRIVADRMTPAYREGSLGVRVRVRK